MGHIAVEGHDVAPIHCVHRPKARGGPQHYFRNVRRHAKFGPEFVADGVERAWLLKTVALTLGEIIVPSPGIASEGCGPCGKSIRLRDSDSVALDPGAKLHDAGVAVVRVQAGHGAVGILVDSLSQVAPGRVEIFQGARRLGSGDWGEIAIVVVHTLPGVRYFNRPGKNIVANLGVVLASIPMLTRDILITRTTVLIGVCDNA